MKDDPETIAKGLSQPAVTFIMSGAAVCHDKLICFELVIARVARWEVFNERARLNRTGLQVRAALQGRSRLL